MRHLAIFLSLILAPAFLGTVGCSSEDADEPTLVEDDQPEDDGSIPSNTTEDGGDEEPGDDAEEPDDDNNTPTPTASDAASLGEPCTAASPLTQGDCPDGYTCMSGIQGINPFCSIACTEPTVCNNGYAGPGVGNCVIGLEVNGAVQSYCGIICQDLTPDDSVCGGQCDGSCPSNQTCSFDLQDQNMNVLAQMCL